MLSISGRKKKWRRSGRSSSPCGHAWSTSAATTTPHPAITCPQAHRIIVSNYFQSARQNGPFNHGLLAVQSGWQASTEDYIIRSFEPIWNSDIDS